MSTIAKTRVGTSDDASICKGFALFPSVGTARAGVSLSDQTKNLLNKTPQILAWKFGVTFGYQFIFGVCGPAYGTAFDVAGTIPENSTGRAQFTFSSDNVQAGFFFGASLRVFFSFNVQEYRFRWVWDGWDSHLEGYWASAFSASLDIKLDLIAIALDLIKLALKGKDALLKKVDVFSPALQGCFGMLDGTSGELSNDGTTTVKPTLTFPLNIVPLIPGMRTVVEGLEKLWGALEGGPTLGIVIPTDVSITEVTVKDAFGVSRAYKPIDPKTPVKNGVMETQGPRENVLYPDNISVKLTHSPGFDISLGVYVKVSVCKLFELNASTSFELLDKLGIKVKAGPYDNTVSNTIGRRTTGRAAILPTELSQAVENPTATTNYRLPKVAFRPRVAETVNVG